MQHHYGQLVRISLNYDVVFLSEVITQIDGQINLADSWDRKYMGLGCLSDSFRNRPIPAAIDYASHISVLLAGIKIQDNRNDSSGFAKTQWNFANSTLRNKVMASEVRLKGYGLAIRELKDWLAVNEEREKSQNSILSANERLIYFSEPTSMVTGIVFRDAAKAVGRPELSEPMFQVGFQLGGIAYMMDALMDRDQDLRVGTFNCLLLAESGVARADQDVISAAQEFMAVRKERMKQYLLKICPDPKRAKDFVQRLQLGMANRLANDPRIGNERKEELQKILMDMNFRGRWKFIRKLVRETHELRHWAHAYAVEPGKREVVLILAVLLFAIGIVMIAVSLLLLWR
jgi:hypothetical protein